MSKVDRDKLARGSKLTPKHVWGDSSASPKKGLQGISAEIGAGNIVKDQMSRPRGVFRVNLSIPYIASDFIRFNSADSSPLRPYSIPFTLPPLQPEFSFSRGDASNYYSIPSGDLMYRLEEVSFGFDQRGEPAAILDQFWNDSGQSNALAGSQFSAGFLDYDKITSYEIRLALGEKTQTFWSENYPQTVQDEDHEIEREVWNLFLPPEVFAGTARANPIVQGGMSVQISPYKTYAFQLFCQGLNNDSFVEGFAGNVALVGVEISMLMSMPLTQRDVWNAGTYAVQNMPTKPGLLSPVALTEPAVGTQVQANSGDGVNTAMLAVDQRIRQGLSGGYTQAAEPPPIREILHDASYEVRAIPLFAGRRFGGIGGSTIPVSEPWVDAAGAAGTQIIADRNWDILSFPFVIHHAILAWNWSAFLPADQYGTSVEANKVASAQFKAQVGVNLFYGLRSDGYGYQNIASLDLESPQNLSTSPGSGIWNNTLIDRVKANLDSAQRAVWEGTFGKATWDWELHSIPLVGSSGTGYFSQGYPVWASRGTQETSSAFTMTSISPGSETATIASMRTPMFDGSDSAIYGRETHLEVRCHVSHANTVLDDAARAGEIYVGYGGCWVYLIGKKHLSETAGR